MESTRNANPRVIVAVPGRPDDRLGRAHRPVGEPNTLEGCAYRTRTERHGRIRQIAAPCSDDRITAAQHPPRRALHRRAQKPSPVQPEEHVLAKPPLRQITFRPPLSKINPVTISGELQSDLYSRVSGADDKRVPLGQVRRGAVLVGVELCNVRTKQRGPSRPDRRAERTSGDHYSFRSPLSPGRVDRHKATQVSPQLDDSRSQRHLERVRIHVCPQVVGNVILPWMGGRHSRKPDTGKGVKLHRSEEAQRLPPAGPALPDRLGSVQNPRVDATDRQFGCQGEPRLTRPDDEHRCRKVAVAPGCANGRVYVCGARHEAQLYLHSPLYSQWMLTIASRLDVMNRLGRAMADPTRSRILLALLAGPGYPARLAETLELTRSNVSNHLTCLRGCGIVVATPEGRQTRYEISDSNITRAFEALIETVLAVDDGTECEDDEVDVPLCCEPLAAQA